MKINRYLIYSFLISLLTVCGMKGYAQVTVTSSDSLSCSILCTTLTAHVVGDTPTESGITVDDQYSVVHPIGFTYNYYGINYTQLVIGANGTLDFNTSDAGSYDPWPIGAALLGNSSKYNNICAPWCDIYVPAGGTITYSTDGVAPNRKFAVTWCHCAMFSCTTQWITTQAIIYESTNIAEIHIAHHTFCTSWNGGYAIVGVQNATGTKATVAPGRDYPSTWTATDEAWRFSPVDTGTGVYYVVTSIPYAPIPYESSTIYWYNATTGAFIDSGASITVCPTVTTTYKAAALGCSDTSFGYYTVVPTASLVITTSSSNPTSCGACDGTITIFGLTPGSTDTIDYELGGVAQPPVIRTATGTGTVTLTGLCAGTYSNIIASQGGLCVSVPAGPVVLSNPPISISGVAFTNPTVCGLCNGSITIEGLYPGHLFTVTYNKDGVPQSPISATSNGAGAITISGLCGMAPPYAGTVYDNIVASFGDCVTPPAGPVTLAAPPPPPASIISSTNPSQCGMCDGAIVIRPLPSLTTDSVFYSLGGIALPAVITSSLTDSSVYLTALCAGAYTSFSVNIGQCDYAVTGSENLVAPPMVASFTDVVHYGCKGDTVFYTNLSTNPGPLSYLWTFGDGTSDTAASPYHVYAQGIYTVTMAINNGYCTRTLSAEDSLIHPLKASFLDSPVITCQGSPVVFTNNTDSFSTAPLSYVWYFGDGSTSSAINPSHTYQNTGKYTVQLIATNFVPCLDTTTAQIVVDSLSPVSILVTDSVFCRSTYVTFTGIYTSLGNTGVTWYFGDGDSLHNLNPASHSYDTYGQYTVTATAHFRVCRDTSSSRTIDVYPQPSVNVGSDTSICPGGVPIRLTDHINENTAGATWKWSTGATTPFIDITTPGDYWLIVGINGCYSSDSILVQNNCYMDIPNVFTPNNDGLNDHFFPRNMLTKGLTSFKMDIYNRWGQLIFETTSLDGEGWDGKLNNVAQPEGVYVFMIEATFQDGQVEHHQGNVTLLR